MPTGTHSSPHFAHLAEFIWPSYLSQNNINTVPQNVPRYAWLYYHAVPLWSSSGSCASESLLRRRRFREKSSTSSSTEALLSIGAGQIQRFTLGVILLWVLLIYVYVVYDKHSLSDKVYRQPTDTNDSAFKIKFNIFLQGGSLIYLPRDNLGVQGK